MSTHTLPIYFQKTQFTSRIGETERKQVEAFLQKHFPDGKYPASAREFLEFVLSLTAYGATGGFRAVVNQGLEQENKNLKIGNTSLQFENNDLKAENVRLKADNEYLKSNSVSLESAGRRLQDWLSAYDGIESQLLSMFPEMVFENVKDGKERIELGLKLLKEKQPATIIPFTGLDLLETEPRLAFLRESVTEDTKTIVDVFCLYKRECEAAIWKLIGDPLHVLEGREYEVMKTWFHETFVPALEANIGAEELQKYGIEKLKDVITGRHFQMMMFDFCVNDPTEKLLAMFPELTPAQKQEIAELAFPSRKIVESVLHDLQDKRFQNLNPTTDAAIQLAETENETEGGKIVAINANGAATAATDPANNSENGNKPE